MSPEEIFSNAIRHDYPVNVSGVYFISICHYPEMKKSRLVYIGSSKNMRKRVSQQNHPYSLLMKRLPFHFVVVGHYFPCINYLEVEKICISHFNPILNKQHRNG